MSEKSVRERHLCFHLKILNMLKSGGYVFLKFCSGANGVSGFLNIILNFNSQSYILERIKYAVQQDAHAQICKERLLYFVSNPFKSVFLPILINIFHAFLDSSLFKLLH